ncbi:Ig-like domain-containing protein [Bacteriovorax sp. PP10]|uniref:Ig-like domain-containing protein n=1 Tax=Bacteriovorax antarcticus TaxID=3088717 RepID=A0ABU5VPS0_9BACT|nr:Ig-like domain-containing protein [Bacteriovorax sp. PP10]MEA9355048.1 Ig-like domain-containing protein [Bacteriovorax sp. PP10]
MIPIKSFIKTFLFLTVLLVVGCVGKTQSDPPAGSPEVVNRLIANNITPPDFQSRSQSIITLSYTSVDNDLATSCTLSHLSNVTVTQACSCDGLGVCNVGVTGIAANTGAGSFSYNLVAGGKTSTTGKANFNITAPPAGSNVPPTIKSIDPQRTYENIPTSAISFTIGDTDSVVACSDVTATSTNTTLIPVANIVITGSAPTCYVTITPVVHLLGSSNIVLTLTDKGAPLPAKTATSSFTLTVDPVNDAPTISTITPKNTAEDTTLSGVAFTIADIDSTLSCSSVTAVSSNTSLVSNNNITITGTAPNCFIAMSPTLNQSGTTNITLTVTDTAKTASTVLALTVDAVNDPPVVATIATQNTIENIAKAVNFTITDVDSNLTCNGSVVVTSSNTTLVPNTNVVLTGIAPNCTATITPANNQYGSATLTVTASDNGFPMPIQTASTSFSFLVAQVNKAPTISSITNKTTNEDTAISGIAFTIADTDSTIYCNNVTGTSSNTAVVPNGNIVVTGTAPNCTATITPTANAYGSSTITLTLNDNGTPMPAMTATSVFNLTVSAVNDVPTISSITNKTTSEGAAITAVAFTINDSDSTLSCTSSVTVSSSNTALIPNANVTFAGTAPNCTLNITPAAALNGNATLTLTLTDNGTPLPALTATTSFGVTVTQVNHAPTISAITTKTTNEDTALTGIAFTIADSDSTVACSNVVGTSTNTTLVPNVNIVITGTAPNCLAAITPVANGNGSSAITLTLTDNGTPLPAQTATSIFTFNVTAVNDTPTISAITSKSTDEDVATNAIAFTITDIDSTLNCSGSVAGTSTNTTLIPNANIVISGTAPNCSAVITPDLNQSGSATITLTLTDNGTPMPGLTATTAFSVTVAAVPDLSGTLTLANNLIGIASSYSTNTYARTLKFDGLSSDESFSSIEVCLGTAAGSCDVSSWVEATGVTPGGSAPSITYTGNYRMKSGVGGAQTFSLTPSCGSTTNYYYSIRGTNASAKISNVVSTPAWSFWEPTCMGTGLAMWLDAMETSTITVATGVSNWTDKSTNGRTVTQPTAGRQPAYSLTAFGTGLPGVTFDGVQNTTNGDTLTRASFIYAQGGATVFSVLKAASNPASRFVFGEGGTSANTTYAPFATTTSNTLSGQIINTAGATELPLPASTGTLFDGSIKIGAIEDAGNSYASYVNGLSAVAATGYTRGASTITQFRLGARYRNADVGWMSGTLGEFIVTNGVASTLNRQRLEGYSAHKWGVSTNLPAGHPYLTTPP